MSQKKSFYITTTLPYVNAEPHIGFAMELIRADVIARWKKLNGFDVFFNTGTDEHGLKIYRNAEKAGIDVQEFVDGHSEKFKELIELLGIDKDVHFIRTTDKNHIKAAQEFWKRCEASGDIEKKIYKTKYCVGCELEKTDSELIDNKCCIHPHLEIEIHEEENYFFKFSKYQKKLIDFYQSHPTFIIPEFRFNEIKSFVERGLEDFSISRLKEKMPWGVPVPGDSKHVMYVWFDALVSYISTLDWPENEEQFTKFWTKGTPTQYAGKDNLRQQSAMWQAMLMSAGLPNSHQIIINGFINSNGQKMSKSLGNVISPEEIIEEYGQDALRYFVCRELSNFEDSDFTKARFKESYNANLANGLGNLVSRVMKMSESNLDPQIVQHSVLNTSGFLERYEIGHAINLIWEKIALLDRHIQETEPFKLIKTNPSKAKELIGAMVITLGTIAYSLEPFMPETSAKILLAIKENKLTKPLFPRKDA